MNIESNNIKKIYLKFLVFSVILVTTYIAIDYMFFANTTQKIALKSAVIKLNEREAVFNHFISNSKDSLHALRDSKQFKKYLDTQTNTKDIEDIFLTFSKSQTNYMQLRYIDKDGFEKIRIDRNIENGTPTLIEEKKLQNKLNRYYFSDSTKKQPEKVWFSPLDLNMEKGEIQTPYNPTFRAILPIKHNDEFKGIIIINYFMKGFLKEFLNLSLYDTILFDNNGYTLKHYDSSKDWGYFKEDKFNISKEFETQYKQILSSKVFKTSEFVTKSLNLSTENQLYLLLKLKRSYIKEQQLQQLEHYIIVGTITFIMSLIITILIGKRFASLIYVIEEKTKEQERLLSLFEYGDSVLFKWNSDEKLSINYVSSNVQNLLGYTPDEFLSEKVVYTDCIYKDDLKHVLKEKEDGKELKGNFFKHNPYRIITKDGTIKWVLDYTVISKDNKGDIIYYLGYLIDITVHENLRINLEKFIDNQDSIVILTDGTQLNFANQKFYEFTGFKDLENFKKSHKCICENFIENDRFFHLGKIDENENWLEVMKTMPHSQRIVSMMGDDFKIYAFSVAINEFDDDLMIVSFANISQTILNQIRLEEKTIHDKLTGAYNREYFEQNYQRLINEYKDSNHLFGLALLDIDHFKLVNDNYGHDVGDYVLQHFVHIVQKSSRDDDIFIRWGGEEFILALKVKDEESLEKALEHVRKVIEMEEFETIGQKTCSIGGTIYRDDEEIETTIKRADEAVYEAKDSGRNKVIIN